VSASAGESVALLVARQTNNRKIVTEFEAC